MKKRISTKFADEIKYIHVVEEEAYVEALPAKEGYEDMLPMNVIDVQRTTKLTKCEDIEIALGSGNKQKQL